MPNDILDLSQVEFPPAVLSGPWHSTTTPPPPCKEETWGYAVQTDYGTEHDGGSYLVSKKVQVLMIVEMEVVYDSSKESPFWERTDGEEIMLAYRYAEGGEGEGNL